MSARPLYQIVHGRAEAVLAGARENDIDAIVCDPPAGIAFMGKDWDRDKGGRDAWVAWMTGVMSEALRVLKPGGHALVWALPRTSHWTATALEDAGFEIRDVVTHHFGSGFPKSLDVSKAIDKAAGAERQVVGTKVGLPGYSLAPDLGRTTYSAQGRSSDVECAVTAPTTDGAREWAGWGTALKPASEHWILCRKPLAQGTVADQVLGTGTGAINIDGCRVQGIKDVPASPSAQRNVYGVYGSARDGTSGFDPTVGRFPPNLVFTHSAACGDGCAEDCPVGALDRQSGERKAGGKVRGTEPSHTGQNGIYGAWGRVENEPYADEGGASRFFPTFRYAAKASKREKNAGVDGANTHPTVKNLDLMRWLCRLITPPGGTVLDMFCGSGSTGVAAVQEGFRFIGIDAEAEYVTIASARLAHAAEGVQE